jgi:hypothetical protein
MCLTWAIGCLGPGPTLPDVPMPNGTSEATAEGSGTSGSDPTASDTTGTPPGSTTMMPTDGSSGPAEPSSGEPPETSCETDVDLCDAWILPPGAAAWQPRALDPASSFAPGGPVVAAFEVAQTRQGYVITESTYHVLDLVAGEWVGEGQLTNVMPEAAMHGGLNAAFSISTDAPDHDETITLFAADGTYWVYELASATASFTLVATGMNRPGWEGPNSPAFAEIRGYWVDLDNAQGWAEGDIERLCGMAGPLVPHGVATTSSQVYVQDGGYCFDFFPPQPFAAFAPFALPDAPPPTAIGAALFGEADGLWIFRG